jgi:hypothetical protein
VAYKGTIRMHSGSRQANLKLRGDLENLGVNEGIILKHILKV